MNRRAFLKLFGGILATSPALMKMLMTAEKTGAVQEGIKQLKKSTTEMPEWLPGFIEKIKMLGKSKEIDEKVFEYVDESLPGVKVTEDLGEQKYLIEGQNEYGRPYAIEYEPPGYTMVDERTGKAVKTKGDFRALDSVPEAAGPEDVPDFFPRELDEVDDILGSDVRVMEEFATGSKIKNPKRGESAVSQAELRAENAAEEAAIEADEGFAKGGLAYLLGEE